MINKKDSLTSNYEPKSNVSTNNKKTVYDTNVNVSNVSNISIFLSLYAYNIP